ncbi:MAG TPA: phosphoribosyltransferase family protein [Nitriliruptorales bacterium]
MPDDRDLEQLRRAVLEIVLEKGYQRRDEPFELASGELSHDFVDGKAALARGDDLALACRAILAAAAEHHVEFDAVGGLTMGADQFAHGVAVLSGCSWFVVRKQAKGRGTDRRIEGHPLHEGVRVLLVDDVVTTGGSIQQAYHQVAQTGATVVFATTLVDRGDVASRFFQELSVPYEPLLTYRDLDIPPVGGGRDLAESAR